MSKAKQEQSAAVKVVFERHRRRYGARRIRAELSDEGVRMGRQRIRKMMMEQNLAAIQPKSYVPRTTDSRHDLGRSPNLLLGRAKVAAPNEVVVGDITYIPMIDRSFLYLATWQDMFSRKIVGWELLDHMRSELVINAFKKAIVCRKLPEGLVVHSDGGGQYASEELRKLLSKHKFCSSMTRRDNHYDNAMAESLFSRFKAELMEKGAFDNFQDAYTEIFEYIEVYYNRQRRHSSIGYCTPEVFERRWEESQHNQGT